LGSGGSGATWGGKHPQKSTLKLAARVMELQQNGSNETGAPGDMKISVPTRANN